MEPNSIDAARAVMALADAHGLRLNLTQLQKLLYIVYGTCLVILGHPPFRNEPPRAWPFGPVFQTARRVLFDAVDDWDVPQVPESIPEDIRRIIEKVITHFGSWPSGALIDWVCTPGAPWYMTTKMPGFKWADKIGDGLITDYFESHVIRRKDNG